MKKVSYMLAGVLIGGVLLNGNAINAAASLMAERSSQPIYVDGQQVELEAYNIGGNNYVKLRDVGKAVGFNVSWDGSAVQIDSDAPYEDDTKASPAPTAAQASATVTLPADGSKYIPKVGDVILCDDGSLYEVKDTLRWENNVYAPGALPDLPKPTCDWSLFPDNGLPNVEVRRYHDQYGDDLFMIKSDGILYGKSLPVCRVIGAIDRKQKSITIHNRFNLRNTTITKAGRQTQSGD